MSSINCERMSDYCGTRREDLPNERQTFRARWTAYYKLLKGITDEIYLPQLEQEKAVKDAVPHAHVVSNCARDSSAMRMEVILFMSKN